MDTRTDPAVEEIVTYDVDGSGRRVPPIRFRVGGVPVVEVEAYAPYC